ncbi:hypothetical protein HQ584_12475 [Patescibacteria group bacterium]|nr:hypothetical protein [Patescibacteria group bacterium]
MRKKRFLAAILLGVSFCFVSGVGYGEVIIPPKPSRIVGELLVLKMLYEDEPLWPYIEEIRGEMLEEIGLLKLYNNLLTARINYMMSNPTTFTSVYIYYDSIGWIEEFFEDVNTKGKIYVVIRDFREYFSDRSGVALKEAFKIYLDVIYSFIENLATDMDNDIVALFISEGGIRLGYFYQGEYHLWEE